MISYEQTLWLWERLCPEEINLKAPEQVPETAIRHCIFSLQERGKYTFYAVENCSSLTIPHGAGTFLRLSAPLPSTTASAI